MRYVIVLNAKAGGARRRPTGGGADDLRAAFARAGVDADTEVAVAGQLSSAIRRALASRPQAVIVGGGDGSVRCAAGIMAGTGVSLGVLPMGTFNHFARDLRIPTAVEGAVAALADGVPRAVDLGEVNGQVFVNNCSLGAYAEAIRRRDDLRRRRGLGKWAAMVRASVEEFRRLRRLRLRVRTDRGPGRTSSRGPARLVLTPAVVVGNNRYGGRVLEQPLRPCLDEGALWLYTLRVHRRLPALRLLWQAAVRRLDEVDALAAEPAREIVIETEGQRVPVAADGEILDVAAPFRFRIRPGALQVLVPRDGRAATTARDIGECSAGRFATSSWSRGFTLSRRRNP